MITLIPSKFSYLVTPFLPIDKQRHFPDLNWVPRLYEKEPIQTVIARIVKVHTSDRSGAPEFSDDDVYEEGDICIVELNNAVKFTSDGKESYFVGIEDILVRIVYEEEDNYDN